MTHSRLIFNTSVFIFFQSHQVKNCTEIVYKHSFVMIERWFDFWCRSIRILHLRVMNCIFSLLKTRSIVVNWLWASQVIVSDFSNNFSLVFVMMFSRVSVVVWWVKHLHLFQWEWCRLKSFTISCLQSFLSSLFKWEMIEDFSVNVVNSEHEL